MGEIAKWRRESAGPALPQRELRPSEVIWRFGTPMFCLDVLSEEPLDVVFTGINAAQSAASGMKPADLLGLRPHEALPPRAADNVMANYRRCVTERRPIEYEEVFDGPEGERWFHTTLGPWTDTAGRVVAVVGSGIDVTPHKQRADDDAGTIARLRHLSDEVRTFSSMAAHDVRSPLATVESLVELVVADIEGGDVATALSLLRDCGEMVREARGQMDGLLRHANALGTGDTAPIATDLGRMGRDISAIVDPQGKLSMSWPLDTVEVDAVTLQLILRNLIGNAARHCEGRVAVSMDLQAGPDGFAGFTVHDDGPGFDRDPFAGADILKRHETVSGFGLASARHLIESRGGAIGVVPGVRGGAVRFTIPCRPARG